MTRLSSAARWLGILWLWLACTSGAWGADEPLPPAPPRHFNDYAGVVDAATARELDQRLAQFERDTSNQLVVAVFKKLETRSSVADYTWRIAESWKVGQAKQDNGAVLFVFTEDRKMYIQVGYGLEGALPDAICKRIIDETLKPAFQRGDFAGGLRAGVEAMIAATKGEYQGTGKTVAETQRKPSPSIPFPLLIIAVIVIIQLVKWFRPGVTYDRRGRRRGGYFGGGYGPVITPGPTWSNDGGSSWSGGGFSGGSDSGGFSGGGGSFGGGGAGGDW
jgi:uncharacterized protein